MTFPVEKSLQGFSKRRDKLPLTEVMWFPTGFHLQHLQQSLQPGSPHILAGGGTACNTDNNTDFHWFQKCPQMPRSNVNPDTAMGEYRVLVQSHPLVTAWCTAPRCCLFFSPPSSYCSVHRRNPFLMFSGQDNSFSNSWIDKPLID